MLKICLWALMLLMATGCARPRFGLDTCTAAVSSPAGGKDTFLSLRYRVRTDAGKPAAMEIGRFMERAAALWTPMFGVPDPSAIPLEIDLYRDTSELGRLLASQKLTSRATGLYLPVPSPAVHVACFGDEPGHPYRTLLHEGTHQFIHLGAGYREPGKPATGPRLALPLWLSEGLASYYEAAYVTPDLLLPGRADPDRLAQLQSALRQSKVPELEKIMARGYGEPFASLDYAIAWGVVHALMQEAPPAWATGGQEWLKSRIDAGRKGIVATGEIRPLSWEEKDWWREVTEQTLTAFRSFVASRGLTVIDWEKAWRDWILAHP